MFNSKTKQENGTSDLKLNANDSSVHDRDKLSAVVE